MTHYIRMTLDIQTELDKDKFQELMEGSWPAGIKMTRVESKELSRTLRPRIDALTKKSIIGLRKNGQGHTSIAKMFRLSRSSVVRICRETNAAAGE